ncbi:hypothetical protein J7T55_007787 [Diaporthe amygdali]|uniref:uncharacterized protein n=1 Tax=Phomopsis amygdali TaxID=1214568 RepID=UPI0022FDE8F4|nr:uncharacterized protein J7T55_007787 [Diaporthe amygdali]KAJ0107597.1 hypothetical protein J7T55_007787 [Diaporthe amygdali]
MANSRSPPPDTNTVMTETKTAETNQLKRKSFGASPDPDVDENEDAPNKRPRTEDSPGRSPKRHGNGTNKNGHGERNGSPIKDAFLKEESLSPNARRQRQAVDIPSSPEQRRRPSESRRYDDRSPTSPSDRRGSETSRRMSSSHGAERDRDRRESYSQEEKKRGRRLFGGLLSTLSQTTANSQQKRRLEIEKKQQEKAVKQKTEDDKRRTEKLARLDKVRRIEQVRFDEQVMRTRHSNMLAMAHSLRTRSEPKLYYRPWELTQEQEDIIKDQIRDAEDDIADEVRQFKRRKEQRLRDLGALALPGPPEVDPTVAPTPKTTHHEDKDHDEMVEAEEDTVIY